jgi:hypothetical protein
VLVAVNSTFPHFPGFVVTNVPADGNCQFAALALQLERRIQLPTKAASVVQL